MAKLAANSIFTATLLGRELYNRNSSACWSERHNRLRHSRTMTTDKSSADEYQPRDLWQKGYIPRACLGSQSVSHAVKNRVYQISNVQLKELPIKNSMNAGTKGSLRIRMGGSPHNGIAENSHFPTSNQRRITSMFCFLRKLIHSRP